MSGYALQTYFTNPDQAKACIRHQIAPFCKSMWANGVERLIVTVEPEDDAKTVQQGRFLWGIVYQEIAHQAVVGGVRYTSDAWHELMKRQYLPRNKVSTQVAGRKRPVVYTTIGSTKGLSVKKMAKFIEQVIAYGVTELGVRFSETRWENHR
jgi:NinB protein